MLTQDGQALQKALEALRDWSASRTQLPATVKQISLL
jgi:DNA-binding HxlR family transcriptional regulator